MPVLNLPPGMAGAPPPMLGGPPGAPPNPMQAALASVLMPRQAPAFPIPRDIRVPRPTHKKARGRMSPVVKAAVKAKATRALAHF